MEDVLAPIEPIKDVVITIEGKTVEANVTMEDGSKKMEWFWYEIDSIVYNHSMDITYNQGDEIIKPAGSLQGGVCVKREDVKRETQAKFICNNRLRIRGEFDSRKLQFIRIDGLGIYDKEVYYYDGEAQMQSIISDKEASEIESAL